MKSVDKMGEKNVSPVTVTLAVTVYAGHRSPQKSKIILSRLRVFVGQERAERRFFDQADRWKKGFDEKIPV